MVIVVLPFLTPFTLPFAETVATLLFLEVKVILLLAVFFGSFTLMVKVLPFLSDLVFGVTVIFLGAVFTVTLQVTLLPPAVAVIFAEPFLFAVILPFLTVATFVLLLFQVTFLSVALAGVTFAVNLKVYFTPSVNLVLFKVTLETDTV